jgi:hypothetical protein
MFEIAVTDGATLVKFVVAGAHAVPMLLEA